MLNREGITQKERGFDDYYFQVFSEVAKQKAALEKIERKEAEFYKEVEVIFYSDYFCPLREMFRLEYVFILSIATFSVILDVILMFLPGLSKTADYVVDNIFPWGMLFLWIAPAAICHLYHLSKIRKYFKENPAHEQYKQALLDKIRMGYK